jgi:hypothetical protein
MARRTTRDETLSAVCPRLLSLRMHARAALSEARSKVGSVSLDGGLFAA